jgi:hypothetical protein
MTDRFSTKWIKVTEPYPHVFHVELSRLVSRNQTDRVYLHLIVALRTPVNAFNSEYDAVTTVDAMFTENFLQALEGLWSSFSKVESRGAGCPSCSIIFFVTKDLHSRT